MMTLLAFITGILIGALIGGYAVFLKKKATFFLNAKELNPYAKGKRVKNLKKLLKEFKKNISDYET